MGAAHPTRGKGERMYKNKVTLYGLATNLTIEHPIEYPDGYGYEKYSNIVREIYKMRKGNPDAYISPTRIDKVLEMADKSVALEYDVKILLGGKNHDTDN